MHFELSKNYDGDIDFVVIRIKIADTSFGGMVLVDKELFQVYWLKNNAKGIIVNIIPLFFMLMGIICLANSL